MRRLAVAPNSRTFAGEGSNDARILNSSWDESPSAFQPQGPAKPEDSPHLPGGKLRSSHSPGNVDDLPAYALVAPTFASQYSRSHPR